MSHELMKIGSGFLPEGIDAQLKTTRAEGLEREFDVAEAIANYIVAKTEELSSRMGRKLFPHGLLIDYTVQGDRVVQEIHLVLDEGTVAVEHPIHYDDLYLADLPDEENVDERRRNTFQNLWVVGGESNDRVFFAEGRQEFFNSDCERIKVLWGGEVGTHIYRGDIFELRQHNRLVEMVSNSNRQNEKAFSRGVILLGVDFDEKEVTVTEQLIDQIVDIAESIEDYEVVRRLKDIFTNTGIEI